MHECSCSDDRRELGLFLERVFSAIGWEDVSVPFHSAISTPLIRGREIDLSMAENALDLWIRGQDWAAGDDGELDDDDFDDEDDEWDGVDGVPSESDDDIRLATFTTSTDTGNDN